MTVAQKLIEQGLQRGRIETLLIQLQARFGELPDHVVARVRAAPTNQLELWTHRVLTAPTLDLVFAS